jgi:hypothetical protein
MKNSIIKKIYFYNKTFGAIGLTMILKYGSTVILMRILLLK